MIYYNIPLTFYRGVEQLVVRQAHNLEVTGSSPVPATKIEYIFWYVGILNKRLI